MERGSSRLALGALTLVGVWILTYWLWPASDPPIIFDSRDDQTDATDPPPMIARGGKGDVSDARSDRPRQTAQAAVEADAKPSPPESPKEEKESTSKEGHPARKNESEIVQPRFDEYIVRQGDDIWTIAERVYGDRELWQAIAKANPLADIERLRAGRTLRIPLDPQNIQGVAADQTEPAPPDQPVEYVVESGDTLSEIAQRVYGQSHLWRIILDANSDRLSAPEDLRPGMRLVIPPPPGR